MRGYLATAARIKYPAACNGVFDFAQQYEGLVSEGAESIYGKRRIMLPTPEYVVFYNGTDTLEDESVQYLSESFTDGQGSGCLECRCRILNINRGHNNKIVTRCRRLWEYSEFVSEVNEWIARGKAREEAIQLAMDFCIEHDILRDILIRQRTEVLHMLLTEFDEKKYKRTIYNDGYEDGELAGYSKGETAGYEKGKLEGEQAGFSRGEQAGFSRGEQAGFSRGEQAGFSRGEQAGFDKKLRLQVQKKLQMGKEIRQIAEELDEELTVIQKIAEDIGRREKQAGE